MLTFTVAATPTAGVAAPLGKRVEIEKCIVAPAAPETLFCCHIFTKPLPSPTSIIRRQTSPLPSLLTLIAGITALTSTGRVSSGIHVVSSPVMLISVLAVNALVWFLKGSVIAPQG